MTAPDVQRSLAWDQSASASPDAPPRHLFGMSLIICSSILISFGGLVMRSIEDADAWQINFYRASALIVAVLVILLVQYGRQTVERVRGIGRAGLFAGTILAGAGLLFLQALTHTTVANTLFTLSAIPFITAVLASIFLKEKLKRATLLMMLVAAAGITVMVAEGISIGSAYGNSVALLTAFCFAGFAVIVRRNRHVDMLPTILVSAVLIAAVALLARLDDLAISWHDLLLCMLWGGVLSGFGNWMFIIASRYLVAAEVTLFILLEFTLGPLWVWFFIGETPTRLTIVGGFLVIAAVLTRAALELRSSRRMTRGRPSPG